MDTNMFLKSYGSHAVFSLFFVFFQQGNPALFTS